jgi:hypothetical protein
MREWLKRAVLKTAVPERVPGVRIPLPPPLTLYVGKHCARLLLIASFDGNELLLN